MNADGDAPFPSPCPRPADTAQVRRARPPDLPWIAELAREHAAFERAAPPAPDLAERLATLLFCTPSPCLACFVVERGAPAGHLVGYATCAPEISTWDGCAYLHLDCLFLRSGQRGLGHGALLMDAVTAHARDLGLAEIQWQTPAWNEGAVRFYERLGARAEEKLRFSLPVGG